MPAHSMRIIDLLHRWVSADSNSKLPHRYIIIRSTLEYMYECPYQACYHVFK